MTHQHPPTECTDEKALTQVITEADISNSIHWYWQNSDRIWNALPLTVEGATISHWWQLDFEERVIPAWRSGRFSKGLAKAYIYAALRRLFKGLRERASPE